MNNLGEIQRDPDIIWTLQWLIISFKVHSAFIAEKYNTSSAMILFSVNRLPITRYIFFFFDREAMVTSV